MIYKPYEYQQTAMQWIMDKPKCQVIKPAKINPLGSAHVTIAHCIINLAKALVKNL